jgi:hypothetical protein
MSEQSLAPNMPVTPSKRQFYLRETAPLYILRAAEAFGGAFSTTDTQGDEFIAYLDTAYPDWTRSVSKATMLNYHVRGLRGYGCLANLHRGRYALTAEGRRQLERDKQLRPTLIITSVTRDAHPRALDASVPHEN